jgi:hypothetical protein
MAQKLSLEQVKAQFPGAWEAEIDGLDGEEVDDLLKCLEDDADDASEFWEHDGRLYSRSWWTAYGWHYGEWTGMAWVCPDTGEVICPWTGTRT